MQSVGGGPVKIGFSDCVERRQAELEATYGQPLAVLAVLEGGLETEREIHGRFSHLRLGKTEQFRPASDLMVFIGRPLLVMANPEAVEAMRPVGNAVVIVHLKGSAEYADWLDKLHRKTHIPKASMFRLAMELWAKQNGHGEPPGF
jgi:hypothetical protein